LKRQRTQSVRDVRRAGALYGGREPGRAERKTLGDRAIGAERRVWRKSERGEDVGRGQILGAAWRESPRGEEKLRRAEGPDRD